MTEQSKDIEEFPNYRIYPNGDVQNIKTCRILKACVNSPGYKFVTLCKKGTYKSVYIHRLLGIYFKSKPSSECTMIDHIDRDRLNNNLDNLRWVSRSQNGLNNGKLGVTKVSRNNGKYFYIKGAVGDTSSCKNHHYKLFSLLEHSEDEARQLAKEWVTAKKAKLMTQYSTEPDPT